MRHSSRQLIIALSFLCTSVAMSQFAQGAITVRRYDGSGSNNRWGNGANWSPSSNVPNSTSETARYNGNSSGRTAINFNGFDFTIGQLDFDNPTTATDLQSSSNGSVLTVDPSAEAGYSNVGLDMSNATKGFRWRKNSKNWQYKLGASQIWLVTGSGNLTIDNGVTVNLNNKTLTANVGTGRTITANGVISGGVSSNIIKTGFGILRLNGSSTYSGNTTISGGQIDLDSGQIYSGSGTYSTQVVTVDNGTTLRVQNFGKSTGTITSLGNLNLDAARVVVDGGTIIFTNSVTNGRGITVGADGATLNVITGVTWTQSNANANVYTPGATLTLTGVGTGQINNTIDGAGVSVVKSGSGTWTLTGANSYTGNTTINNGTLKLTGSGSVASSSLITVASAGTFDVSGVSFTLASGQTITGGGTVLGNMTLDNGATIAPGNSPGTTTYTGNQTWVNGVFEFEIDDADGPAGTTWDLDDISGSLDLTGLTSLEIDVISQLTGGGDTPGSLLNFDLFDNYTWTFATAAGGILGFDANDFTIDTSLFTNNNFIGSGSFTVEQDGNDLNLVYHQATIPEPSSLFLAALGLVGIGAFGRRRKWRV